MFKYIFHVITITLLFSPIILANNNDRDIHSYNNTNLDTNLTGLSETEINKFIFGERIKSHESPWSVLFLIIDPNKNNYVEDICTGSLIEPVLKINKAENEEQDSQSTPELNTTWRDGYNNPSWLLTAAHCLANKNLSNVRVIAGSIFKFYGTQFNRLLKLKKCLLNKHKGLEESDYCNDEFNKCRTIIYYSAKYCDQNVRILTINNKYSFIHENYNPKTYANDIAILKINSFDAISNTSIQTIPLATRRQSQIIERQQPDTIGEYKKSIKLILSGWGDQASYNTNKDELVDSLHTGYKFLNFVNHQDCYAAYKSYGETLPDKTICAGKLNSSYDACRGDSGGSLFYNTKYDIANFSHIKHPDGDTTVFQDYFPDNILIGITSKGPSCRKKSLASLYSIFTRLAGHRLWIEKNILCSLDHKNLKELCELENLPQLAE